RSSDPPLATDRDHPQVLVGGDVGACPRQQPARVVERVLVTGLVQLFPLGAQRVDLRVAGEAGDLEAVVTRPLGTGPLRAAGRRLAALAHRRRDCPTGGCPTGEGSADQPRSGQRPSHPGGADALVGRRGAGRRHVGRHDRRKDSQERRPRDYGHQTPPYRRFETKATVHRILPPAPASLTTSRLPALAALSASSSSTPAVDARGPRLPISAVGAVLVAGWEASSTTAQMRAPMPPNLAFDHQRACGPGPAVKLRTAWPRRNVRDRSRRDAPGAVTGTTNILRA